MIDANAMNGTKEDDNKQTKVLIFEVELGTITILRWTNKHTRIRQQQQHQTQIISLKYWLVIETICVCVFVCVLRYSGRVDVKKRAMICVLGLCVLGDLTTIQKYNQTYDVFVM